MGAAAVQNGCALLPAAIVGLVLRPVLGRDAVAPVEPAAEIDETAAVRAERAEAHDCRLAANGAGAGGACSRLIVHGA